ncbi:MAG: hypothetical protein AAFX99_15710, partial [Myxococcota bacterium]
MTTPPPLFFQDPPQLTNTYQSDTALQRHLTRLLDPLTLEAITPELNAMGAHAQANMGPAA